MDPQLLRPGGWRRLGHLSSASAAFKHGDLHLWQITFTHGASVRMPLTRRHIYKKRERQPRALAA